MWQDGEGGGMCVCVCGRICICGKGVWIEVQPSLCSLKCSLFYGVIYIPHDHANFPANFCQPQFTDWPLLAASTLSLEDYIYATDEHCFSSRVMYLCLTYFPQLLGT